MNDCNCGCDKHNVLADGDACELCGNTSDYCDGVLTGVCDWTECTCDDDCPMRD